MLKALDSGKFTVMGVPRATGSHQGFGNPRWYLKKGNCDTWQPAVVGTMETCWIQRFDPACPTVEALGKWHLNLQMWMDQHFYQRFDGLRMSNMCVFDKILGIQSQDPHGVIIDWTVRSVFAEGIKSDQSSQTQLTTLQTCHMHPTTRVWIRTCFIVCSNCSRFGIQQFACENSTTKDIQKSWPLGLWTHRSGPSASKIGFNRTMLTKTQILWATASPYPLHLATWNLSFSTSYKSIQAVTALILIQAPVAKFSLLIVKKVFLGVTRCVGGMGWQNTWQNMDKYGR